LGWWTEWLSGIGTGCGKADRMGPADLITLCWWQTSATQRKWLNAVPLLYDLSGRGRQRILEGVILGIGAQTLYEHGVFPFEILSTMLRLARPNALLILARIENTRYVFFSSSLTPSVPIDEA
jgi:hypothetical protein